MSEVSAVPAADSAAAFAHYSASLAFETDCADVHSAMAHGPNAADFVLLDVRSPARRLIESASECSSSGVQAPCSVATGSFSRSMMLAGV